MPIFTSFGRRRPESSPEGRGDELPEGLRQVLPVRFVAVGEALASAADTRPACAVAGRDVARDGAALGEALDGLRTTFDVVLGLEPDLASVEALSIAWSEATLEFLHDLSCEDPLTGLASLAHLRARLDELYRQAEQTGESVATTHALVVAELTSAVYPSHPGHRFTRTLHLLQATQVLRSVFAGEETIARLAVDRVGVVVRRGDGLGASVGALRELLTAFDLGGTDARLWIEGLPGHVPSARRLLDELAR